MSRMGRPVAFSNIHFWYGRYLHLRIYSPSKTIPNVILFVVQGPHPLEPFGYTARNLDRLDWVGPAGSPRLLHIRLPSLSGKQVITRAERILQFHAGFPLAGLCCLYQYSGRLGALPTGRACDVAVHLILTRGYWLYTLLRLR